MTGDNKTPETKGPIAWMARNSVAANLLMVILLAGGIFGVFRAKQEVFPEFSLDMISVQVPYPGASPEEVEQGIILAVEEAVRGLDGVKRVTSKATENMGQVTVELLSGENPDTILADVKNAVDRITSFPEQAEKPLVKLLVSRARVISMIISGKRDLMDLHQIAETARADLLATPDITQVEIEGIPPLEVSIEIPQDTLDAYGLTLPMVAATIKQASIELPGGSVKTAGGEVLVRVSDRKRHGHEFENIILRSFKNGSKVRLGDIATITDGFEESDAASFYNGDRAVRVTAFRIGDETPKQISKVVRDYEKQLRAKVPSDISLDLWQDDSEILTDRIRLLNKNAVYGFILVVALLALVLRLRLALWVALGIPVSFLAAFFLMPGFGASINMVTLFAFIVTLGMVVDDAIVIGENIYHKMQQGLPKMRATIEGAQEMAMPVTFSILTTVAAFAPMLFVPGVMGKIFLFIPLVVILVLLFSLLESFFILPAHLAHHTGDIQKVRKGPFSKIQQMFERGLDGFIEKRYRPFLERTLRHRLVALAVSIALLLATIGIIQGGFVPFKLFPTMEGDLVQVSAQLPFGTPVDETIKVQRVLEKSAMAAIEKHGGKKILKGMFSNLGSGPTVQRGPHAGGSGTSGSHLLTIELNLVPSNQRHVGSEQIQHTWEELTPPIAGLKSLVFKSSLGPSAGAAVDVLLKHDDINILEQASADLAEQLRGFSDLTDIENSFSEGKKQVDYNLLPKARALGLTSLDVASQIRGAFYGTEALREQRGRNEIKVMVRYPKNERESEFNIEQMLITTPEGGKVPLSYVAKASRNLAPTAINREAGKRTVNVTAELATGVPSAAKVIAILNKSTLPQLARKYPGLSYEMAGEQREQKESMGALAMNFAIALLAVFALLAIPFRSYIQPVIIMVSIPFGIIGAIGGHLLMGYNLSFISMMGIVALAGVVVNDALVLVDAANQKQREGATPFDAVVYGGTRRFRPIMLTSLTTFLGLMPMISETSLQARFLIPMAISLGFGVLFATFITLLLVPSLYLMVEDVRTRFSRFHHWINH